MSRKIKGFDPIVFENSKVLLLGTLPGQKSLEKEFYYADKSNYFWKFFIEYTHIEELPTNMDEAKDILKKANAALWDIFESAERVNKSGERTNSDKDISNWDTNDIEKFLKEHPNIKKIGALGGKAFKIFQKEFPELKAERLPSSSGANARCWNMSNSKINRECRGWREWYEFLSK